LLLSAQGNGGAPATGALLLHGADYSGQESKKDNPVCYCQQLQFLPVACPPEPATEISNGPFQQPVSNSRSASSVSSDLSSKKLDRTGEADIAREPRTRSKAAYAALPHSSARFRRQVRCGFLRAGQ